MYRDPTLQPRDESGRFAEKLGSVPEVSLLGNSNWPALSTERSENGWSEAEVAASLKRTNRSDRTAAAAKSLENEARGHGGSALPPGSSDFDWLVDQQGIAGISLPPTEQSDGTFEHEVLLARNGFFNTKRGRFTVRTDRTRPPSAGEVVAAVLGDTESPLAGQNQASLVSLYSAEEVGEMRDLQDGYRRDYGG